MKIIIFSLLVFLLLGSCATVREKPEFNYHPPIEEWVNYFEAGYLSKEQFLDLIKGSFAMKEMEALKIIASWRSDGGMSALARKTRIKVDEEINKDK
jgi:hypothetical protein